MNAEQAAWEAPSLRPTLVTDDEKDKHWSVKCPPWCDRDSEGHEADTILTGDRLHRSHPLRVRQDDAYGYIDDDNKVSAGHLVLALEQRSRAAQPNVRIETMSGGTGEAGEMRYLRLAPLYLDEARELVAVLQHLLRVAQEAGQ